MNREVSPQTRRRGLVLEHKVWRRICSAHHILTNHLNAMIYTANIISKASAGKTSFTTPELTKVHSD